MSSSLRVRGLAVTTPHRPLLADVDLELPSVGITWLVGPVAAGKSTLLRTLAGVFDGKPGVKVEGEVDYIAAAGDATRRPRLVAQQTTTLLQSPRSALATSISERGAPTTAAARELAEVALIEAGLGALVGSSRPIAELSVCERRLIAIAQAACDDPPVILIDEPTANLAAEEGRLVVAMLAKLAQRCALLVVTHDQGNLRDLPGALLFLAGGRIVERSTSSAFLAAPATTYGEDFAHTGGCAAPSLLTQTATKERPPAGWIKWIIPERLAGTPRPGLLRSLECDLEALQDAGVSTILCLEEQLPYEPALMRAYGFDLLHAPIADMCAAPAAELEELSHEIAARIARGACVVVHCRAGLGRTGTILAATLVTRGISAAEALGEIRRVEPRFVQSSAQLDALLDLERLVTTSRRDADASPTRNSLENTH